MPERSPDITPRCTHCGSDAVVPDVFLYVAASSAQTFKAGVYTRPSASVLKKPVMTDATYRACGDCGFIMPFVTDPRALWDAHIDRLADALDDD